MNGIPDFWRAETFHALLVHFPIVLVLFSFLFKLPALFRAQTVWNKAGSLLLFAATLFAWLSIYTGNLADAKVGATLCDPTVLKAHETYAYVLAYSLTGCLVIDFLTFQTVGATKKRLFTLAVIAILFACTGFVGFVAHNGVMLVYQQGAGVYKPTQNCIEFE
jgi:uncharacterized membrane protein